MLRLIDELEALRRPRTREELFSYRGLVIGSMEAGFFTREQLERDGLYSVMRGQGDKAFVAGADIKEMVALNEHSAAIFINKLRHLCDGVRLLSIPVIARIPGWTLGGGLEFALACDLRIGSSSARLGMPEVQVGIPSIIHAALMPRLIGKSRASWMLLTGEVADAEQALIAGRLPNRPELLANYVRNAPSLVPGAAMPAMPISDICRP
mgnify:CR=1 FL=1